MYLPTDRSLKFSVNVWTTLFRRHDLQNHHRKGSKVGLNKSNKTEVHNNGALNFSLYKHGNLVNISCKIIFLFNVNEND